MNIKQKKEGEKLTLCIEGSIDTNTAPELNDLLERSMPHINELVMDFEKVDYISSAGLRIIIFAQKTMSIQGKFYITHVNDDVMEIFEMTSISDIVEIIND